MFLEAKIFGAFKLPMVEMERGINEDASYQCHPEQSAYSMQKGQASVRCYKALAYEEAD